MRVSITRHDLGFEGVRLFVLAAFMAITSWIGWYAIDLGGLVPWWVGAIVIAVVIRLVWLIGGQVSRFLTLYSPVRMNIGCAGLLLGIGLLFLLAAVIPGFTVHTGFGFVIRAIVFGFMVLIINSTTYTHTFTYRIR